MSRKSSILRKNLVLSIGFGLCMGIVFPLYSLFFVNFKSTLMAVYFSIGCLVAGFLVGIFSYIINTRPVVRMAKRVNRALKDVRTQSLTLENLGLESDDVLGELAGNFVNGITLLRRSLSELGITADSAISMSGEIARNIETTLQSADVLFSTIDLISEAATELDSHNGLMENGFDGLSKATLLNVSNIIELYTHINEFGETIFHQTESLNHVVETLTEVENLVGSDDETEKHTLSNLEAQLGKRVHDTVDTSLSVFSGIKERLHEIDGIAERTNILSINAAIEAARMGKDGSGFRVIASNIKALAEEVRSLTARISSEMAGGEQNLSSVTGYLNETVGVQAGIIGDIRGSIGALSKRNDALAARMSAVEENRISIDSLLKDIKDNMQHLKQQVIDTRENLSVLLSTSMVIHSGINTLSEKSSLIVDNGKTVTDSLERFKKHVGEITLYSK